MATRRTASSSTSSSGLYSSGGGIGGGGGGGSMSGALSGSRGDGARNRSLLGLDDEIYGGRGGAGGGSSRDAYAMQSQELMLQQNQAQIDALGNKVSSIKRISEAIHIELDRGNHLIDDLQADMGGVTGLLKGSMNRLGDLAKQGGSRHMCYLILFIVGVFLVLYYLITHRSGANA